MQIMPRPHQAAFLQSKKSPKGQQKNRCRSSQTALLFLKKLMALKTLLKPNKKKMIVDLLIILVWLILILSISSFGCQKLFFSIGLTKQILGIIVSILFGLIIYYPLACSVVFMYNRIAGKEKKYEKKDLIFAVLLVVLFNPFTYSLITQGVTNVNHNIINQPCGIETTDFAVNSPAKDAGITTGEIIIDIDNNKIDTIESFTHAMANKHPGDYVSITTDVRSYTFKTIENPNNRASAFMGIKINQKYCKR